MQTTMGDDKRIEKPYNIPREITIMTNSDKQSGQETSPGCRRGRFLRRLGRCLQWLVNLIAIIALLIIFTPVGDWLDNMLIDISTLSKADYIVVLGGHCERVVEAVQLYRDGWADKVIVSAYGKSADFLGHVAEVYGVPSDSLIIERQSTRTADHPYAISRLPGIDKEKDKFIIVTSPYHTSRARAVFLKAGYRNVMMYSPEWRVGGRFNRLPERWLFHRWRIRARNLAEQVYEVIAWGMYWFTGRV